MTDDNDRCPVRLHECKDCDYRLVRGFDYTRLSDL